MKEGYKKTELGWIPEEWKCERLGKLIDDNEVIEILDGNHGALYPRNSEFIDRGIPYISANSIYRNKIDFKKAKYLSEERADKFKKGISYDGDVLFAHNATVGPVALLETSYNKVILSTSLTYYRVNSQYIYNKYLMYFMSSSLFKMQYSKRMSQTTRNQVPISIQKEFMHLIPPLKEQQKIADILSTVDSQIDDTDKLIEKTKELKKGLMQRLLTKGIGHSEFKKSEVGEIPVEWEVKKFKNVSSINQGLQIAIEDRFKEASNDRLPYLTIQYINDKNNKDNEYYIESANDSVICRKEDILMTRTGNTGMVITNENGVFHNNFFKVNFDRNIFIKDFLVYYLKSKPIQTLIMKYAGTTTIPDLKHSDFYRIPVVIPFIEEQQKIADILLSVDNQISEYQNKKSKLEELKKGLMQQLLTGKIRVV